MRIPAECVGRCNVWARDIGGKSINQSVCESAPIVRTGTPQFYAPECCAESEGFSPYTVGVPPLCCSTGFGAADALPLCAGRHLGGGRDAAGVCERPVALLGGPAAGGLAVGHQSQCANAGAMRRPRFTANAQRGRGPPRTVIMCKGCVEGKVGLGIRGSGDVVAAAIWCRKCTQKCCQ